VKDGAVEVTAAGSTVTVNTDEQTQVEGNDPPRDPQPATRADVESRYPGVFPPLEEITGWAIRENDVWLSPTPTVAVPTPTPLAPTVDQAPGAPSCLEAASFEDEVDLSWCPGSDDVGIAAYNVYRDDVPIATVGGTETFYSDFVDTTESTYVYYVTTVDTSGKESAPGPMVYVPSNVFPSVTPTEPPEPTPTEPPEPTPTEPPEPTPTEPPEPTPTEPPESTPTEPCCVEG
jgi:hypothetical protein